MKYPFLSILFFSGIIFISGCKTKNAAQPFHDLPEKGTIYISVDESFRPVMEQQVSMYEASYPAAHIIASYKSEADCIKDFFRDSSTRLVIVTRGLTRDEEDYMMDSLGYRPGWNAIASDAVAVIVPSGSNDTVFSIQQLAAMLTGKSPLHKQVIFDGLNATSTVRFIKDSILKGKNFDTSFVKAVKNSKEVINYVADNENAIGLVGISWIGNPEEPGQVKSLEKVKIAYVQCDLCDDRPYVKPMQQSVLSKRYPLVRGLYYIIKENYTGLGTGFISFLKYERGQLIFRRAYLGTIMDFRTRNVKINESLPKK